MNFFSFRTCRGVAGTMVFALAVFAGLGIAAASDHDDGSWRTETSFGVRVATHYYYNDGNSTIYPALGAQASFELTAPNPAFAAGLFADYELATNNGQTDIRMAGGWTAIASDAGNCQQTGCTSRRSALAECGCP